MQKKLFLKLGDRVTTPVRRYPVSVRAALRDVTRSGEVPKLVGIAGTLQQGPSVLDAERDLKLAYGRLGQYEVRSWEMSFDDPEQMVSLHRWNWLLVKLTEAPFPGICEWGLGLMRDWIARCGDRKIGLPWESYSTGERICNAILFLAFSGKRPSGVPLVPEDIRSALCDMAEFLAHRLEYHGTEATGNHVINNARALCFAGQVLGVASYTQIAFEVLRHDLPVIVNRDGFLREGSSHYHFLVTRWLLEVLWIAEQTGESRMYQLVEPVAASMVKRCWYFLLFQKQTGDWVMPLIGDVSPDYSWRWLLDLPWTLLARKLYAPSVLLRPPRMNGWGFLFNGCELSCESDPPVAAMRREFQAYQDAGWYRLEWGSLVIFWHIEPDGAPSFVSHGHCDIGAFCLYWDGMEVLADPGRCTYQEEDWLGDYGVSACAHNSVLVDRLEPFIYRHRGRYPAWYRQGSVDVSWQETEDLFRLTLSHTGFVRLCGDFIVFRRTFLVSRNQLAVEDRIEGASWHAIETYFQWAPNVKVTEEGPQRGAFRITSPQREFDARFVSELGTAPGEDSSWQLMRGQVQPEPGGWYFPGYGERVEATSLRFDCWTKLPYHQRFVLTWVA